MPIMPLLPVEFELNYGRFARYRAGEGYRSLGHRAILRIDSTPSSTTRALYRRQWFAERTEWAGDALAGSWSIFIPSFYEDPDCRVEFWFEEVKDAVHFALRWKGET